MYSFIALRNDIATTWPELKAFEPLCSSVLRFDTENNAPILRTASHELVRPDSYQSPFCGQSLGNMNKDVVEGEHLPYFSVAS